ncbi:OprD family outer membrane porin [Halopseudomonas pachastrellae]|nr:OprD family outer membrane porin [Halopseudomonas pachastrellae]
MGGTYAFNSKNTTLGLWRAELQDVYGQNLINLIHSQPVGDWKLGANLAWFDTSDDGNQPLDIDNELTSITLSAATGAHTFRVGYQQRWRYAFPYLAETDPYVVNYVQILDFTRANEKSWQARYDINFASLGIPGLSAFTRYVSGDNFDVGGSEGSEWERDIDVSYTVQTGTFKIWPCVGVTPWCAPTRPATSTKTADPQLQLCPEIAPLHPGKPPRDSLDLSRHRAPMRCRLFLLRITQPANTPPTAMSRQTTPHTTAKHGNL